MSNQVLIIGGTGRIGSSVAQDLINYTNCKITVTSRNVLKSKQVFALWQNRVNFLCLDFTDLDGLNQAIASSDLVIDCAGPFHHRSTDVLQLCIIHKVHYLDVSDHRSFSIKNLALDQDAQNAGIIAVINTGVFPGISNSMVKESVESLDIPESIHLSYVVSGSGGAGITVMRTTFLSLQEHFKAFIQGKWQDIKPYSSREIIDFPYYGKTGVYWFDVPETLTLAHSFPVHSVITKFGSVPDFYNHLTWIVAHLFPSQLLKNNKIIEFLSQISYNMTNITDKFSGIGVAMRAEVSGKKDGKNALAYSTFYHENTAYMAGCGTGMIAQLILEGKINQCGVFPVEKILSSELFNQMCKSRNLHFEKSLNVVDF